MHLGNLVDVLDGTRFLANLRLVGEFIDLGVLELASRDFVFKQNVNLAKGTVLGLGQTEPAPDKAEQVGAGVEQTRLGTPVPGCVVSTVFRYYVCGEAQITYTKQKACEG